MAVNGEFGFAQGVPARGKKVLVWGGVGLCGRIYNGKKGVVRAKRGADGTESRPCLELGSEKVENGP